MAREEETAKQGSKIHWSWGGHMGGFSLDDMSCITHHTTTVEKKDLGKVKKTPYYLAAKALSKEIRDGQKISVTEDDNGDGTINVSISIPDTRTDPHRHYSPLQELFEKKFAEFDRQSHT